MTALVTTAPRTMQLQHREAPEPGAGQVRVRPRLAGICGTDLHIYQGHHPNAVLPVVQGHEFVGVVDAIGPQVEGSIQVGQRVVVEPLVSCGRCEACRRGFVHVCRRLNVLGVHRDGAFATAMVVDAAKVIAVPDRLDDRVAVLTEPFAVALHDCRRAGLVPAERVLVIGAGPIGLAIAMVARASSASVTICEVQPPRLELADSLGLDVIDARHEPATAFARWTDGEGFDVVFEVSGTAGGVRLATDAACARGRVAQVGLFTEPAPVDLNTVVFKELTWLGSRVYSFDDFRDMVGLLDRLTAEGGCDPAGMVSETCTLAEVSPTIDGMIRGEVAGKALVALDDG